MTSGLLWGRQLDVRQRPLGAGDTLHEGTARFLHIPAFSLFLRGLSQGLGHACGTSEVSLYPQPSPTSAFFMLQLTRRLRRYH